MKFYEKLFQYYDDIFPFNKDTYTFLKEGLKEEDKVLDVACGTGVYSIALQKDSIKACGIDLDENMIKFAEEKAVKAGVYPDFIVTSMLNIELVSDGNLRRIFIIGNSLVHLKSLEEVRTFLNLCYDLIMEGGDLIIRILNYDRIIDEKIEKLPTLDVPLKGISFDRNYRYEDLSHLIEFSSILHVKDQTHEASVYLLPLRKDELIQALDAAGFKELEIYSTFKKDLFTPESMDLIIKAKKKEV